MTIIANISRESQRIQHLAEDGGGAGEDAREAGAAGD